MVSHLLGGCGEVGPLRRREDVAAEVSLQDEVRRLDDKAAVERGVRKPFLRGNSTFISKHFLFYIPLYLYMYIWLLPTSNFFLYRFFL